MNQQPRLIAGGDAGATHAPALEPGRRTLTLVWDIAVRVFHWCLVAGVAAAWLTGGTGSRFHELAGSVVGGLLIFRIIWGFSGTSHARFADFVRSPGTLLRYVGDILRNRAGRHIGHNPAGGYMIVLLLLCLTVLVGSGGLQLTTRFFGVVWIEQLHMIAANTLLVLIPIHLLGVVVSSWMHQENLIGAMMTGTKHVEIDEATPSAAQPSTEQQILVRLHANQGFTVLMFLLAGGVFVGWNLTAHRTETTVVEIPQTPAVAAIMEAVQESAAGQAKDRQDFVVGGPEDATQTWLISSGGRLYDNWYAALGKKGPQSTHPSWPAANTSITGEATWRCKSCHGWDYAGREGRYRSGANSTGIIGLQRVKGLDPAVVMRVLDNATHAFTNDMLPQHAKYRLALFVSRGQHTTSQYVLPNDTVRGDAERGKPIFQSVCASCHGFDGRARKLGVSSDPSDPGHQGVPLYVGTKAVSGPTEVLHKIRNGHPGAIMVSMRPFPMDVAVNLLAYAQTLPSR